MDNQKEEIYVEYDETFQPFEKIQYRSPTIENDLRQHLEEIEQELRQAAQYGLHLLAKNDELLHTIIRMEVEHESALNEIKGEMSALDRHLQIVQSDRDAWKLKYQSIEIEIYQLQQAQQSSNSLLKLSQIDPHHDADLEILRQTVQDKESQLKNALVRERDKDAHISRLQQTKRDTLDIIQQMKTSARVDAEVRQALDRRNNQTMLQLQAAQEKLDQFHTAMQVRLVEENRLKGYIEELENQLEVHGSHAFEQSSMMLTMKNRCARLEQELHHVGEWSSLQQPSHAELSAAVGSFDRLRNHFHLTALGIILKNRAQDQFLDVSSRKSIQHWFDAALEEDIPYHEWHAWLTDKISSGHHEEPLFKPFRFEKDSINSMDSSPSSLAKAIASFFDKYKHQIEPRPEE